MGELCGAETIIIYQYHGDSYGGINRPWIFVRRHVMLVQDKTGMLSARFNKYSEFLGAETVAMIGIKRFRSEIDPPPSPSPV